MWKNHSHNSLPKPTFVLIKNAFPPFFYFIYHFPSYTLLLINFENKFLKRNPNFFTSSNYKCTLLHFLFLKRCYSLFGICLSGSVRLNYCCHLKYHSRYARKYVNMNDIICWDIAVRYYLRKWNILNKFRSWVRKRVD